MGRYDPLVRSFLRVEKIGLLLPKNLNGTEISRVIDK